MEQNESTFQQAFIHLYFLMLSADKIADLHELELGTKIIELEKLDKAEVMNGIDNLSSLPREIVFENGLEFLKALPHKEQLKCLGYIKLISKIDGSVDLKEIELLNDLCVKEINISLSDISEMEIELENDISKLND